MSNMSCFYIVYRLTYYFLVSLTYIDGLLFIYAGNKI